MEQKKFAVGVRIEHRQRDISLSQYGPAWERLPPSDYKLACHLPCGRSAFTFCVCPGGQVVAAASEQGGVVTNGMSPVSYTHLDVYKRQDQHYVDASRTGRRSLLRVEEEAMEEARPYCASMPGPAAPSMPARGLDDLMKNLDAPFSEALLALSLIHIL